MDFIQQALSWIGDFLGTILLVIAQPFIALLPDADRFAPSFDIPLFTNSTFNVAALFDWNILTWGFGILISVMLVCLFVSFVRFILDVFHNVADSIPIIG